MVRKLAALAAAIFLLGNWLPASAQSDALQVYTKPIEPFSFERNGKAAGFSIELWDRIAKELGMSYELHSVKTVKDLIGTVESKQADVGIAAISITSEREKVVDFSTPFYEAGLSILVNTQGGSPTDAIIDTVFSIGTLKLLGLLAVILLLCSHWSGCSSANATRNSSPSPTCRVSGSPHGGPSQPSSAAAATPRDRSRSVAASSARSGC